MNKKSLAEVLEHCRLSLSKEGYLPSTEDNYLNALKQFFLRFDDDFPSEDDLRHQAKDLMDNHLRSLSDKGLSESLVNQSRNALIFFFSKVIKADVRPDGYRSLINTKKEMEFLSGEEAIRVIDEVSDRHHLKALLVFGAGLKSSELIKLKIKDLDFEKDLILGRAPMPRSAKEKLRTQIAKVTMLWRQDKKSIEESGDSVYPILLDDLYLFPSKELSQTDNGLTRKHLDQSVFAKAVREAGKRSGIDKNVNLIVLRNTFAIEMINQGINVKRLQKIMGHKNLETTMSYKRLADRKLEIRSPVDLWSGIGR